MNKLLILSLFSSGLYAGAHFSCHKNVEESQEPTNTKILIVKPNRQAQELILTTKQAKRLIRQMKKQKQQVAIHKHRETDIEVDI